MPADVDDIPHLLRWYRRGRRRGFATVAVVRRQIVLSLSILFLLLVAAPVAAALSVEQAVARLSAYQRTLGSQSSATLVDLSTRTILFQRRPLLALAPASNEKLFTTAAALQRFGADGTLVTTVVPAPLATLDGRGVLRGDLYLVGGGDPSLGDKGLHDLARQVKAAGIRRISGSVRGDDSLFDRRRGGPRTGYSLDPDLGGSLSALAWQHGSTGEGGPALVTTRRFARILRSEGIGYSRAPRLGRVPASGAPRAPVAVHASPPMSSLITTTNVYSDNFYAEMLLKALGARFGHGGTTAAGAAEAREALAPLAVAPVMADGSGLSRSNRSSSRTVATLLAGLAASDYNTPFRASLARAGRSGTITSRMRGTAAQGRCVGKTGTLNSVSALSGYCTTTGGRRLVFSLIENGVCTGCAKATEDRMVATIARIGR